MGYAREQQRQKLRRMQDEAHAERMRAWKRRRLAEGKTAFAGIAPRKRGMTAVESDVALALRGQGYDKSTAKRLAQRAYETSGDKGFDNVFRTALKGKNPMAKKRKRRKNKMPAALRAYWAKRRRKKNSAHQRKKRKTNRVIYRTRIKIKYRYRPRRKRKAWTTRRNPQVRRAKVIHLPPGLTPKQTRAFARALGRASGRRVRIVKK